MRDYPARITKHSTKNADGLPTKKASAAKEYERKDERLRSVVLSPAQKEVGASIRENVVTFVVGDAGTGKTFGVLRTYCDDFIADIGLSIMIIRTPAEAGDDPIGHLPGDVTEKVGPHFTANRVILEELLGKGTVDSSTGSRITYQPPNYALGTTWNNTRVLIDEAQMMSPSTMNLLLSRIGDNCKVAVVGSSAQIFATDRKPRNGLDDALNLFFEDLGNPEWEPTPKYSGFGFIEMPEDSQMRNPVVSSVNHAYRRGA
jgi:phosphate starvation-inducible protein PhoH